MGSRSRAPRGVAVVWALAAVACACGAPRASRPNRPPPEPELSTPWADEKVGADEAEAVRAEVGLVAHDELHAYVNAVGQRIALHAPGFVFDYTFQVVDDDAPNAFALPGGFVFVSRGAVALTNGEDELAAVLGHEIAHVASRHAAARQQVARGIPGFLQILQTPYLAAYGRDLERTADRLGQELAAAAGYDPAGLVRFLDSLGALERITLGATRLPSFLDTHPGTRFRASDAAQRASATRWTPRPGVAADREDHLRRIEGLVVGESAAQGVFDGTRFLHPVLDFTLRFPDRWETANTPRAVGATSPDRKGQVFLEHGGPGTDTEAAARTWAEEVAPFGMRVETVESVRLAGLTAHRVSGGALFGGLSIRLVVTFIPWHEQIYRLVGVTSQPKRHVPVFVAVARSFRPMTGSLLERVEEERLRLAPARAGETLVDLTQRTGNVWSAQLTAVVNGLRADEALEAGRLVKIGRLESYGSGGPVEGDAGAERSPEATANGPSS